jgi:hypothetical protein
VDAVVTDSKGRPVPDLDAGEFEVLQDGKRQTITNFSYIRTQAGPIPETPPAQKAKGAAKPKVAPPRVPPAPLRQDQVRRTIVLARLSQFRAVLPGELGISLLRAIRKSEDRCGEDLPSSTPPVFLAFCSFDVFARHQPPEGWQGPPLLQRGGEPAAVFR